MITVMGATGKTGGEIVRLLLGQGVAVRALGRSEERLVALGRAGAVTMAGDAADASFLTAAFGGADSVYTLLPYDPAIPDYHARQNRLGAAITAAVRAAAVPSVVMLSSVGADVPAGTGFIASLHAQEERLRRVAGTNVLTLRCGWFFENFAATLDLIRHEGFIGDAVVPDLPVPMIATRDIAAVAAKALVARDWTGFTVRELLGPRDLTMVKAAGIIGTRIDRPDLPYVQIPDADFVEAMIQAGFTRDSAIAQVELGHALNDGTIVSREGRSGANTTPTRFEDYATELARAYLAVPVH